MLSSLHQPSVVSHLAWHSETSFLLKRNGPNDQNKMISKSYGCKMGQGEWVWLHFVGVLTQCHTLVITGHSSRCPNFHFRDYDGENSGKPGLGRLVVRGEWWLHTYIQIQHRVSLFTLFHNNLLSACQELSGNSDIKVHVVLEHNMGPAGPMKTSI